MTELGARGREEWVLKAATSEMKEQIKENVRKAMDEMKEEVVCCVCDGLQLTKETKECEFQGVLSNKTKLSFLQIESQHIIAQRTNIILRKGSRYWEIIYKQFFFLKRFASRPYFFCGVDPI